MAPASRRGLFFFAGGAVTLPLATRKLAFDEKRVLFVCTVGRIATFGKP